MPDTNIKKFLPRHFIEVFGPNLPAIYESINEGYQNTEDLIQACIAQLFLTTASGRYLIQLGEESGFTMPANSGLDILAYKALAPIMVSEPKQVKITISELLKVFFKTERTYPNITSTILGPYSIASDDNLIVRTETGTVNIPIIEGQVSDLNNVSATELAAVINYSQEVFEADTVLDRATSQLYLRISSKTPGTGSFIQVIGGTLQNILKFPNLISTENGAGTNWNLNKDFSYTDILKFTWDGIGTDPKIFLAKKGDFVTIAGFTDDTDPFSELNGSFELIDVGYDYFIVRNDKFDVLSSSIVQDGDNIIFTSQERNTIFDLPEFAFVTEPTNQTITITVPAVPPLVKRSLKGSTHLRGDTYNLLDFTRTSAQIEMLSGQDKPIDINRFVISNKYQRDNFKIVYDTVSSDIASNPTYNLRTEEGDSIFPHTTPVLLGASPITGKIGSEIYTLEFPFIHGLFYAWGFTLSGAATGGNVLAADINKEHQVMSIVSDSAIKFRIKDSNGVPIIFQGIDWGTSGADADVYRHTTLQSDGSDFYLEFASALDAQNSGLTPGISFVLDEFGGTDVNLYLAGILRNRKLAVTSVSSNIVNISTGLGIGPEGLIIQDSFGKRDGSFAGSAVEYFVDKTSELNENRIFNEFRAAFLNRTPSSNPFFIGNFLFDPTGESGFITPSKFLTNLSDQVLKGENLQVLLVDSLEVDGVTFPTSGQIVLEYGSNNFEGPIKYFSILKNSVQNQIFIDPAYKFKKTHQEGAQVQFIHSAQPYTPTKDGTDLPAYVTGTTEARETLFKLAELLVASGVFIEKNVLRPELIYDDVAIPVFD